LDFGFWIAECFTGKLFRNPFVAINFQIGISLAFTLSATFGGKGFFAPEIVL
jgi:hypothetical protein